MNTNEIVNDLMLFGSCESVDDVKASLVSYIERTEGRVINGIGDIDGESHWGRSQSAEFRLDNDTADVRVVIDEVIAAGGNAYVVTVEEC